MSAEEKKPDFKQAFNEDPAQHPAASNPLQNYIELNNFDGRPSSGNPEILLHTTEANLIQFRHRGFLAGDTLIAKAVYELGQYRKRTFIDQKFDIDGHATKPATDVAADEDSMFAGIQNLLDQLGKLEKFIHAKPSPENRQSLEEAYHRYRATLVQHFNAMPSSHADRIASGLLSLPAHQTDFSHDAIVGAPLSANGDDSLGEKIRRETLRLLSGLNTYQFLYTRETGHISSGFANTCIKKAISSVNNHSFALSTQAKFKRDLLPDLPTSRGLSTPGLTPELSTIREETRELTREDSRLSASSFKEITEESFEAKAEASSPPEVTVNNHSLNHDRVHPVDNLSPNITVSVEHYMKKAEIKTLEHFQRFANYLNKGEEARPALPLSQFKSFLKAPVLWWRRRSGVDHPSNHSAGFKYTGLVLIKIFAVLADNICGLFTGLVQKNFNFFRKKATRIQFPHQPQDPSVLLEWRIRTKIAPGPTLLNQASQLFSETIGQIGSSVIYSLKAINDGLITLFTDNYVVQKCRGILRAPQSEQTRLLNILRTLNSNTQKTSPATTLSPLDLEREAHTPKVTRLNKPSDSYRSTDLLGVLSETVDLGMLGFSNFALEHPSLSFLIATTFSLAALPTAVKAALNKAIQAFNTPLIAEQISGILPAGKAQLALQTFLNNYLFSKLRLADAAAISTFDVDEFIRHMTSLDAPKFQTNLNLKTLQQKGQAAATAQPQTPEPSSDESMKPLLKRAPGLRHLKIPSPLPSPAPEPTLRDILDPTLLALLANFNQLPFLSQIKKNDLSRYVLKTYSHAHQKPLVDLIIQQCLKTAPITVKNFTLPQSALSKSLVHAIQHVFSFVNMVFSIPRVFIDLARRHQSSLSKRQFIQSKMLFIDTFSRLGSAIGKISFGISGLLIAVLKVPVGTLDQLITVGRFLAQKCIRQRAIDPSRIANRVKYSLGLNQFLSKTSARMSFFFGLRRSQQINQGVKNFKNVVLPASIVDEALQASSDIVSTQITTSTASPRGNGLTSKAITPRGNKVSPSPHPSSPADDSGSPSPVRASNRHVFFSADPHPTEENAHSVPSPLSGVLLSGEN